MKQGDKVTWMERTRKGSGFRFSSKEGEIVRYGSEWCDVRMNNNRVVPVETSELRLDGQETALTQMVRQMGEAYK